MRKHILAALLLCSAVTISASQVTSASPEQANRDDRSQVKAAVDRVTKKREEIEAKRQAIEEKVAEKRAAIEEKLSGPREEHCRQKEAAINANLDTRVSVAQRHFDKFQDIQDKLTAYVIENQLAVDNANALEVIMSDTAAETQAAINAISNVDFVCEDASATAPGGIIIEQIATVKQALKDYRNAIKDYATAVKNAASKTTDTTTEEVAQ